MKAYVITIEGHGISEEAAANCVISSKSVKNDFDVEVFKAVVPSEVPALMRDFRVKWNYPWEGQIFDFKTGLKKTAYPTKNRDARIACALSHYSLWRECLHKHKDILVLEHDARFKRKLDTGLIDRNKYVIIGINNPLFATRKSKEFKDKVDQYQKQYEVVPAPTIDDHDVPQGLAGNSAYIIKPKGAEKMIKLVEEHGLWPNDALMCKQLVPLLGVTTTFYTEVQGTPSTTSR